MPPAWRRRAANLAITLALAWSAACAWTTAPTPPAGSPAAAGDQPATNGQIMVTLAPAPPPLWAKAAAELSQTYGLKTVFAWPLASIGEQCIVFQVPHGRTAERLVERLASDPRVETAQLVYEFEVLADGYNDPYLHLQHAAQEIRLEAAHRWATGKGVKVAVVDTGVDLDHPDLRGRIVKTGNFVDDRTQAFTSDVHGTAVAGVIAAAAGNQEGIVGVAPGAKIFALKACWQRPPDTRRAVCNSYTLAQAVDFAINGGAQVLNFSLAGPADPLLAKLIREALKRGVIVVAADAGAGSKSGFPASLEGVVAILASDGNGGLRAARPAGGQTGLAAPGVDILSTAPHRSYDFFSGSSLAAAHVSGIAALLLERDPGLTPARFAALIRDTAKPAKAADGETRPAVGLVDACAALARMAGGVACGAP